MSYNLEACWKFVSLDSTSLLEAYQVGGSLEIEGRLIVLYTFKDQIGNSIDCVYIHSPLCCAALPGQVSCSIGGLNPV